MKKRELTLRVGTEEVHFNLNQCLKHYDVEQAECIKINNVILVCKEKNYDLMNENSFDNYIYSAFYNDDFEKEELIVESVLSLNERSADNLRSEEKVQEEKKEL